MCLLLPKRIRGSCKIPGSPTVTYLFLQNGDDPSEIISMEPSGVLTAGHNSHDAWQLCGNVILKPDIQDFLRPMTGHSPATLPAAPSGGSHYFRVVTEQGSSLCTV